MEKPDKERNFKDELNRSRQIYLQEKSRMNIENRNKKLKEIDYIQK
jgi:hypothetical protein